ncbi:FAR1-related sequence 10 [Tanacetum coccineum]
MLTAVGVDANNGIYLVAYGIVESENQYSWTWFLTCLADDFDLYTNSNFTFITNKQKGLVPTIAKLFPAAEHRFYVRRINENMNITWKGGDYKEMLWKCATSTTVVRFEKNMAELKNYNKKDHEWLSKIPPEHWSRAYFSENLLEVRLWLVNQSQHVASQTRSRGPVASQPVARKQVARKPVIRKPVQNKSVANKRDASQINEPASQASHSSQPVSQASRLPTSSMKRTKMSACRLTSDS